MARRRVQSGAGAQSPGTTSGSDGLSLGGGDDRPSGGDDRRETREADAAPAAATATAALGDRRATSTNTTTTRKSSVGAAFEWLMMLVLILYLCYLVVQYQAETLPAPVSAEAAGLRGFSEESAMEHVGSLSSLGPHPVGSDELVKALMFVYAQLIQIKDSSDADVDVEVDLFESSPGVERLAGGLFKGKSLVYGNLKHLVVRVSPEEFPESKENAILVSSHVDSVVTSPGAGDCSSCVSVMLEVLRALANWAGGFKHSVIFLFNTGEEEGLIGAHSFITQHKWRSTIRAAIDVEAMGIGGRSTLFQAGPDKWLLNLYASVAKYPAAQVVAQDAFHFGIVKSATDFQVYREVGGLSGLDFAFLENSAVYHTKNDRIEFLRPGSLQSIGEDLLALLKAAALSDDLPFVPRTNLSSGGQKMEMVYFDILGKWMVTYPLSSFKIHQLSFVAQGFLLLSVSLYLSGSSAFVEFGLSLLAIILTWTFSASYVVLVAAVLPYMSPFPIPYIAHPWLVVGLFGAPAVFGALLGHGIGRYILLHYIAQQGVAEDEAEWLAERWLFKAGICQWVVVLGLATWVQAGASYIPLFWIVPAISMFGLLEAQFSARQRLRGLSRLTLWLSLAPGVVTTAYPALRLLTVLVGTLVRFERNPGGLAPWVANAITGMVIVGYCCLMLAYVLPYAHRSSGLLTVLLSITVVFFGTLLLITTQVVPAFTEDVSRAINAVHVVDTTGHLSNAELPLQYISLFSITPGRLEKEMEFLNEDGSFICGDSAVDLVSFKVKYSCTKSLDQDGALLEGQPYLKFEKDRFLRGQRVTTVNFNSGSGFRWNLAINTTAIGAFKLKGIWKTDKNEETVLIPRGDVVGLDDWHYVQFVSDVDGPTDFQLVLYWHHDAQGQVDLKLGKEILLLKARTDIDIITPQLEPVLKNLPPWCSLFGKSTSPYTLVYITDLKVPVSS